MELDKTIYEDPQASAEALEKFAPFLTLFYFALACAVIILVYALWRFMGAQKKLAHANTLDQQRGKKAGMGPVVAQAAKKGEVNPGDYAGLTREEMRLVFDAEVKRREAAGEKVVVRNVFEGKLDWDDVDETGVPRVRAEKAPDFEQWLKGQPGHGGPPAGDKAPGNPTNNANDHK